MFQRNQQFGRPMRNSSIGGSQFIPSTNKCFVRSLEEALSLPADYNSQNVYFDVNKNVMYDICTNGFGERSWSIYNISLMKNSFEQPTIATAQTAAVPTIEGIEERFKQLETKVEDILNGKYNVKQADNAGPTVATSPTSSESV